MPKTPSKVRSLSDVVPTLSPSPKFREPRSKGTQDDMAVQVPPTTPRRPNFPVRGLSLQMPSGDTAGLGPSNVPDRAPLSPKLDMSHTYGSPSSALPRRSRGLDFSRACTNLHHSTLAEQPSAESSPTQTKGMMIPPRQGFGGSSNAHEAFVGSYPGSLWSTMGHAERAGMASSLGSVNMMESDSSGSSSDDRELTDPDEAVDPIMTTPLVYKLSDRAVSDHVTSPFASKMQASPGGDYLGRYSPAAASLMSFQRARLGRGRRSRKSSSSASASGNNSMASPSPASPPAMKSVEPANGYSSKDKDASGKMDISRRSSLNWGTKELHISSGGESDESAANGAAQTNDGGETVAVTPGNEEKRGVIRRAVTRRGNLLPKPKNFARIRAALMEEGAPIDTEFKREAEVVRQVRESEPMPDPLLQHRGSIAETEGSSPTMPTVPGVDLDDVLEDDNMSEGKTSGGLERGLSECFTLQVKRNSGGKDFWDHFDRTHTPPPPLFARASSSAVSEDLNMDSPGLNAALSSSLPNAGQAWQSTQPSTRASTPQAPSQLTAADISRKIGGKRRREDDFDASSFKRRAVSPGMSVQNSPILSQSPAQKEGGWWGVPRAGREVNVGATNHPHASTERANSGSSQSGVNVAGGTKRVGFQGMSDTNDGLMKMSIE